MNGDSVLVLGGAGFIGSNLVRHFSCRGTSRTGKHGLLSLDIRDQLQLRKVLDSVQPDIVVNSTGITNVDYCELHKDEADEINGYCVRNIADASEEVGARLVHISTDYVFSGKSSNYGEDDNTDPINAYGRSKLIGEQMLKDRQCIILRISTPYGFNRFKEKATFLDFLVSNLRSGKAVKIVTDQFTTPTFVDDIAYAIETLIGKNVMGTFNLGSKECVSRFDFAELVAKAFSLNHSLLLPSSTSEIGFVARRPLRTCFNTSKIQQYLKIGDIGENLKRIRDELSL